MDISTKILHFYFSLWCLGTYVVNSKKYPVPAGHEKRDWFKIAQDDLQASLKLEQNQNVAKNVILFIGDGMGFSSIWASRIYAGQYKHGVSGEEYDFHFEKFPHVGLSKTYNVDYQIPDSGGTATALLSGRKVNAWTVGVNENVKRSNCSNEADNTISSILHWSMDEGKSTGVVTTTRVTHATPSAAYAHSAERFWESDTKMNQSRMRIPPEYNFAFGCKDIARQLVEDNPNINVIMGGGRKNFRSEEYPDEEHGEHGKHPDRKDHRDLIEDWKNEKILRDVGHAYVWNKAGLDEVDVQRTDYLLGLFEEDHMKYESQRNPRTDPSLTEMTEKAIEVLSKNKNGFFLMVEGGKIDHAHHAGKAQLALEETWYMDLAVKKALDMTNREDTLIVVTADHSHAIANGGYTSRGLDILGLADEVHLSMPKDHRDYTTLMYTSGPGAAINQERPELVDVDTHDIDYMQQALVPMNNAAHAGEDVPIYAVGPMAHLFHGVHEQHYVAHVMAYASCVGDNQKHCENRHFEYTYYSNTGPAPTLSIQLTSLVLVYKAFLLILYC